MLIFLFRAVLAMSAAGSAAWLLLKIALCLVKKRTSAGVAYYLHLAILFFLLVPLWLLPFKQSAANPAVSLKGDGISVQSPAAAPPAQWPGEPESPLPGPADIALLSGIWLVGSALFLSGAFLRRQGCCAALKRNGLPCANPEILRILQETARGLSLKKYPPAVIHSQIGSPMLVGLFRPVIFLPDTTMDEARLRLVLRHELLHYKRKDLWVKLLVLLANAVHWFNPICWLLVREIDFACELSCDEGVAAGLSPEGRREYGQAILAALSETRQKQDMLFVPLSGRPQDMKRRLTAIMERKPNWKFAMPVTAALAVVITTAGLLVGCSAAPETPAKEDTTSQPAPIVSTISSLQEIADAFMESVSYDRPDGRLAFTVPAAFPENTDMSIHIAGRQSMGEGGAMALHLFEEESESGSWEKGKTYETAVSPETLIELDVQFSLMEKETGKILAGCSKIIKGDAEENESSSPAGGEAKEKTVPVGSGFINPLDGDDLKISTQFGSGGHRGIDFTAEEGTPVYAVQKGTVLFAGRNGSFGNMVEIDHGDGLHSIYAHCGGISVKKGEAVEQGAQIATVGDTGNSTGYHLHLEITEKDTVVDPLQKIPGPRPADDPAQR